MFLLNVSITSRESVHLCTHTRYIAMHQEAGAKICSHVPHSVRYTTKSINFPPKNNQLLL